jgi:hypothetical protein
MAVLKPSSINFYEYLEYWSFKKEIRLSFSRLLELFPHLNQFIITTKGKHYFLSKAYAGKKERGEDKVLKRKLLVSKLVHPSNLLLNYLIIIEGIEPSREQLNEYQQWFGGFNRLDRNIGFIGWVPLDFFGYSKPFVDIKAMTNLPIDTTLKYVGYKSVRLFQLSTYYDASSGLYKTERLVSTILLERWSKAKYEAFDGLGIINDENSITKKVFEDKQRNRFYVKVKDSNGNDQLLSTRRVF